jgi:hypothetical protein
MIFLSLHSVTETGPERCAIISPFFSVLYVSLFLGTFFSSALVCRHSPSCVQSSIFWLDRVSYRNYPTTQSGSVSMEVPPVSEQCLVLLVSAVIKGESSFVSLPAYTRKDYKYPVVASHSS